MRVVLCQRDVSIDGSCGGLGTLYANLAKCLANEGVEITLITATPLEKVGLNHLSEIIVLPYYDEDDYVYSQRVTEKLLHLDFDLVETASWKAELYDYLLLPQEARRPVVVRAELPAAILGLSPRLCKMESLLIERAKALIAVSTAVAEAVYDTYHRLPNAVIGNGVDLNIFAPSNNQTVRAQRTVWVGNYLKVKRLDWLIKIIQQTPEMMFDVVIPDQPKHLLTSQLKRLPNICVYHHIAQSELARLFSQASVTISTSAYEAFGLSLLESMACGTPILIPSTLRGAEDFFQPDFNGLTYSSPSEAACLLRGTDWTQMHENAAWQARRFSWPVCSQTTLALYQSMLNQSHTILQ